MPKKTPPRKKPRSPNLARIAEGLRPLAVPIDDVKPDPNNARVHADEDLAAIAASLARYGQRVPIVANARNHEIEKGHGVHQAAAQLGWSHVAVLWVRDNAKTQTGFSLADNQTALLSDWDEAKLAAAIAELEAAEPDLAEALLLAELTAESAEEGEHVEFDAQAGVGPWLVVVDCDNRADQDAFCREMLDEGRAATKLSP